MRRLQTADLQPGVRRHAGQEQPGVVGARQMVANGNGKEELGIAAIAAGPSRWVFLLLPGPAHPAQDLRNGNNAALQPPPAGWPSQPLPS